MTCKKPNPWTMMDRSTKLDVLSTISAKSHFDSVFSTVQVRSQLHLCGNEHELGVPGEIRSLTYIPACLTAVPAWSLPVDKPLEIL